MSAHIVTAPATPVWDSTYPATPGNGTITLLWNDASTANGASAASGYNVYMGTTAGGESATPVNGSIAIAEGTTQTSTTVTGLTNGTTYYFTVKAINALGSSAASTEVSAAPGTVPGAPTGVTIVSATGQATLSWTAPAVTGGSPVIGYNVYGSTAAPTYNALGQPTAGIVYVLNGGSTYSSATTTMFPNQAAPNCAAATKPLNGYECDTLSNQVTSNLITGTSYTATALNPASTYYFTVTAVNANGESAPVIASNSGTSPVALATAVQITSAVAKTTSSGVTLSWGTSAGATGGYNVYFGTTSGGESATPTNAYPISDNGGTNSYYVSSTKLLANTTYFFKVGTISGGGTAMSSEVSIVTGANAPSDPTGITATPLNTEIVVAWTPPTNNGGSSVTSYTVGAVNADVHAADYNGGAGLTCTYTVGVNVGNTCTVSGVSTLSSYYVHVLANNKVGSSLGLTSPTATFTTGPTAPDKPTGLSVATSGSTATISWTAPANLEGNPSVTYQVFMGTTAGGEASTPVAVTNGAVTSATVNGLASGTTYFFTVKAVGAYGTSAASTESSANIGGTFTSAPLSLSATTYATGSSTTALLTWAAPASAGVNSITGYKVYLVPSATTVDAIWKLQATGTGCNSTATCQLSTTGTIKVSFPSGATVPQAFISGLTAGTTYTFFVTATNGYSNASATGFASTTEADSAPSIAANYTAAALSGAPTNVAAVGGNLQATVSWSAPLNTDGTTATAYKIYASTAAVAATATSSAISATITPASVATTVITLPAAGLLYAPVATDLIWDATQGAALKTSGNAAITVATGGTCNAGTLVASCTINISGTPNNYTSGDVLILAPSGTAVVATSTSITFLGAVPTNYAAGGYVTGAGIAAGTVSVAPENASGGVQLVSGLATASVTVASFTAGETVSDGAALATCNGTNSPCIVSQSGTTAVITLPANGVATYFAVAATNDPGLGGTPAYSAQANATNPSANAAAVTGYAPPTTPGIHAVVAGSGILTVDMIANGGTWGSDATQNGLLSSLSIASWTATAGGRSCSGTTTNICTIVGLTNGVTYAVTVTVTSGATGLTSLASAATTGTPVGNPTAATGVTVVSSNGTSAGTYDATVTWTIPSTFGGGSFQGYTVVATNTTTQTQTSYPLTNANGTAYDCIAPKTALALVGGLASSTGAVVSGTNTCSISGIAAGTYTFAVKTYTGYGTATAVSVTTSSTTSGWAATYATTTLTFTTAVPTGLVNGLYVVGDGFIGGSVTSGTAAAATTVTGIPASFTAGEAISFYPSQGSATSTATGAQSLSITGTVPGKPSATATTGNASLTILPYAPLANGGTTTGILGYNIYVGTTNGGESSTPSNGSLLVSTPISSAGTVGATGYLASASTTVLTFTSAIPTGVVAGMSVTGTGVSGVVASVATATVTLVTALAAAPSAGTVLLFSAPVVLTGLTNGTKYYVTVNAVDSLGASVASTEVSATPATAPGAPSNLVATNPTTGSVALTWSAPTTLGGSALVGYWIYSTTGTSNSEILPTNLTPITGTSYTATGLSTGTTYLFEVVAQTTSGYSAASAEASIKPAVVTPTTVAVVALPQNVTVSFSASPAAKSAAQIKKMTAAQKAAYNKAVAAATKISAEGLIALNNYALNSVDGSKVTITANGSTAAIAQARANAIANYLVQSGAALHYNIVTAIGTGLNTAVMVTTAA